MENNSPTKKLGTMKIAWLAQWCCHAQDERKCLERSGITKKVVDIISARKDFDSIIEIAKNIYSREMLSFSERLYLSNYSLGERRRRDFFGTAVPIFTHDQSDLYRKLTESINDKGLHDTGTKELLHAWHKCPHYITVGHNPVLEIRKVFNLAVYKSNNSDEILECDYPLANGDVRKEKYEIKR